MSSRSVIVFAKMSRSQVLLNLFHQFSFRNWHSHDLIVPFCVHIINITDDLYQLAVVDLRYQDLIIFFDDIA